MRKILDAFYNYIETVKNSDVLKQNTILKQEAFAALENVRNLEFDFYGEYVIKAFNMSDFDELYVETMIRNAVIAFENYSEESNSDLFKMYFKQIVDKIWEFSKTVFILTEDDNEKCDDSIFEKNAIKINLDNVSKEDSIKVWRYYLGKEEKFGDIKPEIISAKFNFTPGSIKKSVELAKKMQQWNNLEKVSERTLTDACYQQVKHKLSERATRIDAKYNWDDLVLPDVQKKRLKEACNQVYYSYIIYEKWGFANKNHYGKGISMLFYGPPGTGKTMTAQVIAN